MTGGVGRIAVAVLASVCLTFAAALPESRAQVETPGRDGPSALREVRVQLKWRHQFQFAGFYAAIARGCTAISAWRSS